jgi:magnesium-transporting ATPase (P-type)
MGTNILNTEILNDSSKNQFDVDRIRFAEVMPEHKFLIVDRIRQQGHVTGMTGDVRSVMGLEREVQRPA